VKMDMGGVVSKYSFDHRGLYAIGFGNQDPFIEDYAKELRHVELGYVPNNVCNQQYGGNAIRGNMMCAADPDQDSCQGDSGGPLFDANPGVEALVGVVSWGYGCADPNYPGVYSKISNRWTWIKNKICGNHSDPKPEFCSNNPIQPQPTPSPIKSPTTGSTPSPTVAVDSPLGCGDDEGEVEVVINLDEYPHETSWFIVDSASTVMLEGGNYDSAYETFTEKACLKNNLQYTFNIYDTYGDGFGFGGSYMLRWKGQILAKGDDNFGFSKSHTFGNQPNGGCGWQNGKMMKEIEVKFKTDKYGSETSYRVKKGKKTVLAGGFGQDFSPNTYYQKKICAPDACYRLLFNDDGGDGMCCEHKKGYYMLFYGGKKIRFSKFKHGSRQVTKFGKCGN